MSVQKVGVEIDASVKMQVDQAEQGLKRLSGTLQELKLPNNLDQQLTSALRKATKDITKYKSMMSQTSWSQGDANQASRLYENIKLQLKSIAELSREAGLALKVDDVIPPSALKAMEKMNKLAQDYSDKIEESKKALKELESQTKAKTNDQSQAKKKYETSKSKYDVKEAQIGVSEEKAKKVKEEIEKINAEQEKLNARTQRYLQQQQELQRLTAAEARQAAVKGKSMKVGNKSLSKEEVQKRLYSEQNSAVYKNAVRKQQKGETLTGTDAKALDSVQKMSTWIKEYDKELQQAIRDTEKIKKEVIAVGQQKFGVKNLTSTQNRGITSRKVEEYNQQSSQNSSDIQSLTSDYDKLTAAIQGERDKLELLKVEVDANKAAFDSASDAVKKHFEAIESASTTGATQSFDSLKQSLRDYIDSLSDTDEVSKQVKQQLEDFYAGFQDSGDAEQNVRNLNQAIEGIRDSSKGYDIVKQKQEELDETTKRLIEDFLKAGEAPKQVEQSVESFKKVQSQLGQLTSRLEHFFSLTSMWRLFTRGVKSAFEEVKSLDKAMTETAVVTNFDVGDMWSNLPKYTQTANQFGATIQDAYEVMTIFYQQGLNTNEVFAVGTQTMKMARIAGLDYAEAADRMTNALRAFNMTIDETSSERVADVYSALAANSASNVNELSVAMTKVASLAASANMEFENTGAFLAQIIETTRESAETAGTALKTVVARFAEVKELYKSGDLTGTTEEGEEVDVNKVSTALRAAGIDLNKFMTGAEGLDDVLLQLSSKWNSLDLLTQRYIATMAAGSRQQSRFLALMSDNQRLTQLTGIAYDSAGASEKQFEKTQDSLESKLNLLSNSWNEFLMGITNSSAIKGTVDALTALLDALNSFTGSSNNFVNSFNKIGVSLVAVLTASTFVRPIIAGLKNIGAEAGETFSSGFARALKGGAISKAAKGAAEKNMQNMHYGDEEDRSKELNRQTEANTKMATSIQLVATAALVAGAALGTWAKSMEKTNGGITTFSSILSGASVALLGFGGVMVIYIGIMKLATIANLEFAASMLVALPYVAAIVAAVAVVVGLAVAIAKYIKSQKESNKESVKWTKEMKAAQQAAEDFDEALTNAKQKLDDLSSGWEDFNNIKETLEGLTKGTLEWTEALNNANQKALELQAEFPELKMEKNADGLYEFDEKQYKELLEKQQALVLKTTAYRNIANAQKQYASDRVTAAGIMAQAEKLGGSTSSSNWAEGLAGYEKERVENLQKQYKEAIKSAGDTRTAIMSNSVRTYLNSTGEEFTDAISDWFGEGLNNRIKQATASMTIDDNSKSQYADKMGYTYNSADGKFYDASNNEVEISDDAIKNALAYEQVMSNIKDEAENIQEVLDKLDGYTSGKDSISQILSRDKKTSKKTLKSISSLSKEDIKKSLYNSKGELTKEGEDFLKTAIGLTDAQIAQVKNDAEAGATLVAEEIANSVYAIEQAQAKQRSNLVNTLLTGGALEGESKENIIKILEDLSGEVVDTLDTMATEWGGIAGDAALQALGKAIMSGDGEQVASLFNNINFESPIKGFSQLKTIADTYDGSIKQLAEDLLKLDNFSEGAIFRSIGQSDEWEDINKELNKFIKKNGTITDTNVEELVRSYDILGDIVDEDVLSVTQLTKAFNSMKKNDLTFNDFTDSVVEAISQIETVQDVLGEVHSDIENFNAGYDSMEGYDWLVEQRKEIYDDIYNGQFANQQLINRIEEILGPDALRDSNGSLLTGQAYINAVNKAYEDIKNLTESQGASFWAQYAGVSGDGFSVGKGGKLSLDLKNYTLDEIITSMSNALKISKSTARKMISVYSSFNIELKKQLEDASVEKALDAFKDSLKIEDSDELRWASLEELQIIADSLGISVDILTQKLAKDGITVVDTAEAYKTAVGTWKSTLEILQAINEIDTKKDDWTITTDENGNLKTASTSIDFSPDYNKGENTLNGEEIDTKNLTEEAKAHFSKLKPDEILDYDQVHDYFWNKGIHDEDEINSLIDDLAKATGKDIGKAVYDTVIDASGKAQTVVTDYITSETVDGMTAGINKLKDNGEFTSAGKTIAKAFNDAVKASDWFKAFCDKMGVDTNNVDGGDQRDSVAPKKNVIAGGTTKKIGGVTYYYHNGEWCTKGTAGNGRTHYTKVTDPSTLRQLNQGTSAAKNTTTKNTTTKNTTTKNTTTKNTTTKNTTTKNTTTKNTTTKNTTTAMTTMENAASAAGYTPTYEVYSASNYTYDVFEDSSGNKYYWDGAGFSTISSDQMANVTATQNREVNYIAPNNFTSTQPTGDTRWGTTYSQTKGATGDDISRFIEGGTLYNPYGDYGFENAEGNRRHWGTDIWGSAGGKGGKPEDIKAGYKIKIIGYNNDFKENVPSTGWGNQVCGQIIRADGSPGGYILYNHLYPNSMTHLQIGQTYSADTVIGKTGLTGNSGGVYHLDMEFLNGAGDVVNSSYYITHPNEDWTEATADASSEGYKNRAGTIRSYKSTPIMDTTITPSIETEAAVYNANQAKANWWNSEHLKNDPQAEEEAKWLNYKAKKASTYKGWLTDYNPISKTILTQQELGILYEQKSNLDKQYTAQYAYLQDVLKQQSGWKGEGSLGWDEKTGTVTGLLSEAQLQRLGEEEQKKYIEQRDAIIEASDALRETKEAQLENSDAIFQKWKEQREIFYGVVDKVNEAFQSVISAVGKLAAAAWDAAKKIAQAGVDAFNAVLKLANVSVDDEHDINAMSSAIQNRQDRFTWEYQNMLKRGFIAQNNTNDNQQNREFYAGIQQALRDNLQLQAKNLMTDFRLQQQLYNNSKHSIKSYEDSIENFAADALVGVVGDINKQVNKIFGLSNNLASSLVTRIGATAQNFGEKIQEWIASILPDDIYSGKKDNKISVGFDYLKGTKIGEKLGLTDLVEILSNGGQDLKDILQDFSNTVISSIRDTVQDYNEDFGYVNKNELNDTLGQALDTVLTSDTLTMQVVKGIVDFVDSRTSLMEKEAGNMQSASKQILDDIDSITELLKTGKDDYLSLQQALYDAIIDAKNRLKEKLETLNNNITQSDGDLISAIQDNLEKIRQQRENDTTERDLLEKEKQLAYLKQDTSNGNLQEILKLEEELKTSQQDYTDKLIDQKVDELEKQNEEAAAQRQVQIDLLQAEIDNEKKTWAEVAALMSGLGDLENGEIIENVWNGILETLKQSQGYYETSDKNRRSMIEEWSAQMRNASNYMYLMGEANEQITDFLLAANSFVDKNDGLLKGWEGTRETINNIYTEIHDGKNIIESLATQITKSNYFKTVKSDDNQDINSYYSDSKTARWNIVPTDVGDSIGEAIDKYIRYHLPTESYIDLILGEGHIAGGAVRTVSGIESIVTTAVDHLVSDTPAIISEAANGLADSVKAIGALTGGLINSADLLVGGLSSLVCFDPKIEFSGFEFLGGSGGMIQVGEELGAGLFAQLPDLEPDFIQDLAIFGEALGYALSAGSHFMAAGADLGAMAFGIAGDSAPGVADVVVGIGESAYGILKTAEAIREMMEDSYDSVRIKNLNPSLSDEDLVQEYLSNTNENNKGLNVKESIIDTMKENVKQNQTLFETFCDNIKEDIDNSFNELESFGDEIEEKVLSFFGETYEKAKDKFDFWSSGVVEWFKDGFEGLGTFIKKVIENINDTAATIGEKIEVIIDSIESFLKGDVSGALQKVIESIFGEGSFFARLASKVSDFFNKGGADEENYAPQLVIEVDQISIEAESVNLITQDKLQNLLLNNQTLGSSISNMRIVPVDLGSLINSNLSDLAQSNGEFTTNINLNLDNLMVDSVDRVEEVAEAVMNKINEVASNSSWSYNTL